jgi:hypothetical protein
MFNTVNWSPGVTLENVERQVILAAYRHFRSNKTQTAQSLGIAIRTLDNKLEKYQHDDKRHERTKSHAERQREEFNQRQRGDVAAINAAANSPNQHLYNQAYNIKEESGEESRGLQDRTSAAEPNVENDNGSGEGEHGESAAEAAKELAMSMQVGKEVQSVSPTDATEVHKSKGSGTVQKGNGNARRSSVRNKRKRS